MIPYTYSLCISFISQSSKTWHWLKLSKEIGLSLQEESITDFNLLELTSKHPDNIKTQKFSKGKEGKIGADWEWWIGSNDNWTGLRIQAKKLNYNTLNYDHLYHKNQIKDLINNASSSSQPFIPLYVFYNYCDEKDIITNWECDIDSSCSLSDESWFGCGLSHANSVIKKKSNRLEDIIEISYPWSCLFCCKNTFKDVDLAHKTLYFLKKGFKNDFNRNDIPESYFITKKPPNYVNKIKNGELLSENDMIELKIKKVGMVTVISS